jgi:elongation factor Ts
MATITADQVKQLREKTGAGMMDCKTALIESGGDFDKAVEYLRKKGLASAAKRAGRAARDGIIGHYIHMGGKVGVLVEVNCETDFVARTEDFQRLAQAIAEVAAGRPDGGDAAALANAPMEGETVAARITAAAGKLGENVVLKRAARLEAPEGLVGGYVHAGGKLGVLVALHTSARGAGAEALAKDVAMHVAAADPSPVAVDRAGVPAELVQRERELFAKQAAQSGKPEKVIEKIVEGRINKFYSEVTLLEQPFVKDPDRTVRDLLEQTGKELGAPVAVTGFVRFRLGADAHS